MNIKNLIIIICFAGLAGCNNNTVDSSGHKNKPSTIPIKEKLTGVDVEPLLEGADSLQILYYDNPDGDSLRYTRFFRYVNVTDSTFIVALKNGLRQTFIQKTEMIKCRSEGKMYVYKKQAIIKTIYFATRCDRCCHLFFISNGSFLYFTLPETLSKELNTLKKDAVAP
ncbi:MAG TPA: hypothetical protein VM935_14445 [Chitinophagaceae bacterium]|nr:hypothetical protein [Chitinophagaceae bacterium]